MRQPVALIVVILCSAGVLRPQNPSPEAERAISEAFDKVGALQPMPNGATYTLTVGGKQVTAEPDYFLRRRTGGEILESGWSGGSGDNAIAVLYLLEKRGYEVSFIDSAQISTQSLEWGFSGLAALALRDPQSGIWVFVDPSRRIYWYPFNTKDQSFYGNYWIGFLGRLADYPAHDPESLKAFYRATLKTIPAKTLDRTLFRFRFTVDPSLIAPNGQYRNPNLERLLRDEGKILAAHGVHPTNEVQIHLKNGEDNATSRCEYAGKDGWVCTLGEQSALSLGFVSYLEDRLNSARDRGEPLGIVTATSSPRGILWTGGLLCLGILAILFWQRRRLVNRETAIAYAACQILGWVGPYVLLSGILMSIRPQDFGREFIINAAAIAGSGMLLSHLLRRHLRRRRWLALARGPMLVRLGLAVVFLSALQTSLLSIAPLAFHGFGRGYKQSAGDVAAFWLFCAFVFTLWTSLYVLLTGPRRMRDAQVQLQLALREAELRALEAQINPHFLFNCLSSIRALVVENPARSQDMLTRLANILRYNLHRDLEHTVPLGSEVEIVGDYLALESARFEDRLQVKISIDPNASEVKVPPMLLQSLVENALKHGIAPLRSGGDLSIRAAMVGDAMLMEVENPGHLSAAAAPTMQVGLANIRERLRLLYNGRASFELKNRDGRVAASVLIPTTA